MKKIRENSAAIDLGAKEIFIGLEDQKVRSFGTFTQDFLAARDYLLSNGIETVAMEATGVYWVVIYEILEEAGLDVWLVDGRQTRQVPGRKTDVKDCQWIQQLHSYGLLNRCFVAKGDVKELRSYMRLREDHIRSAAMHINHMQKALTEMNIRLKEVLNQIQGASGLAMIEAILQGERDAQKLLSLCHTSIKRTKADEVIKALEGHYTKAGLFALRQAYEGYKFYQAQMKACDQQIESLLERINNHAGNDYLPKDKKKKKRKPIRHNKPEVKDLGTHLMSLFAGLDATDLPGITDYTWLQLYSEVGSDLSNWKTEKHFTSWLGLAPGQHNSGKMNRTKRKKQKPKAGQIFRQIAQSLLESRQIALGAFGRKLRAKKGPGIAIKATARKLAELYWRLMVHGVEYTERGIEDYERRIQSQKEKWLIKTANQLGYRLEFEASA